VQQQEQQQRHESLVEYSDSGSGALDDDTEGVDGMLSLIQ
jgi:hypothetical protein